MQRSTLFRPAYESWLMAGSVVLVAVALTVAFLWPLWPVMSTHVFSRADGIFIAWTIQWVTTALKTGLSPFHAPIFLPFSNTLTFSDPFLSTALLNLPLSLVSDNSILNANIHLVLGTFFSFVGMWTLVFHLTKSRFAALSSSLIFTFSQFHLQYVVHLHTYLIAGLPWLLFAWTKFIETERWYWLIGMASLFLYQTVNAPMTGFFCIAILLPVTLRKQTFIIAKKNVGIIISTLVTTSLFILLVYLPYFQTAAIHDAERSIRDTAHFAESINILWDGELIVYTIITLWLWWKRHATPLYLWLKVFFAIAVIGTVLALGPVLKLNSQTVKLFDLPLPLPYAVLYYVIPGFKAFRASSRWVVVMLFGIAGIIGISLGQSKVSLQQKAFIVSLLISYLWFSQVPHLKLFSVPTIPAIYHVVARQPESTLAEFPVYLWSSGDYSVRENDRLLFQLSHRKHLYNGTSGFTPKTRETAWLTISQKFPDRDTLTALQSAGVELVLVHLDEYQQLYEAQVVNGDLAFPSEDEITSKLNAQPELQLITCYENSCLYRLAPALAWLPLP